jgi:hypothetical protein
VSKTPACFIASLRPTDAANSFGFCPQYRPQRSRSCCCWRDDRPEALPSDDRPLSFGQIRRRCPPRHGKRMVSFSAVDLDRSIQGISPYDRAKRVTSSFLVPFSDRHGHWSGSVVRLVSAGIASAARRRSDGQTIASKPRRSFLVPVLAGSDESFLLHARDVGRVRSIAKTKAISPILGANLRLAIDVCSFERPSI